MGGGESVKEYELKVTFPRFFLVFTLKNNNLRKDKGQNSAGHFTTNNVKTKLSRA